MFRAKLIFSNGDTLDVDGVFDTETEAEEYALEALSEYRLCKFKMKK